MKTVKYILKCIWNAWIAYRSNPTDTWKEDLIGFSFVIAMAIVFFVSLFLLDKKTRLTYKPSIFVAILITLLFVGVVFSIIIIIELIVT